MDFMKGLVRLDEQLVDKVRYAVSNVEDVEFMALFGSLIVRGETYHDVDVAVKVKSDDKYSVFCRLVERLAGALSVPEERIDIVDLDRADLDLTKEVATHSLIVVDKAGYGSKIVKELSLKYPERGELIRLDVEEWLRSNDPSSIDLNAVKKRFDFIRSELRFLDDHVFKYDVDELGKSPTLKRLLERGFQLIIEASLDICRHIVSVMGWGPATSYLELIHICCKHGVITEEVKGEMLNAVRLRNVIIHRYLEIDYVELHRRAEELEKLMKQFETAIINFARVQRRC